MSVNVKAKFSSLLLAYTRFKWVKASFRIAITITFTLYTECLEEKQFFQKVIAWNLSFLHTILKKLSRNFSIFACCLAALQNNELAFSNSCTHKHSREPYDLEILKTQFQQTKEDPDKTNSLDLAVKLVRLSTLTEKEIFVCGWVVGY